MYSFRPILTNAAKSIAVLIFVLMANSSTAVAIPITVSFTAIGFNNTAPDDPVSGSIVYEAASTTSTIDSLISISLTIAGHVYTLGEIGFDTISGDGLLIGGLVTAIDDISHLSDDFILRWNRETLAPADFHYTVAGVPGILLTVDFSSFSVTGGTIPEPGTVTLFGLGLLGLGAARRRKKRAA